LPGRGLYGGANPSSGGVLGQSWAITPEKRTFIPRMPSCRASLLSCDCHFGSCTVLGNPSRQHLV